MNIHKHQASIKKLLHEGDRQSKSTKASKKVDTYFSGCYIISQDLKTDVYKLGESYGSGGLYNRIIKQYKICMPLKSEQFYLHYIVVCPRKKEGKINYSHIMEQTLQKAINSDVYDSYSREYFFNIDNNNTENKIVECLKQMQKYFLIAIKFSQSGFYLFGSEKFEPKLYSFSQLSEIGNLKAPEALLSLSREPPKEAPKRKKIVLNIPKKTVN